ncbi:hypothetical protein [Streptomyces sp. H27-C3]|uniref:hypothetical protein n=1 Tax=Streptomyces sp. H27-C3 TaxID=3046305 RepID=UPI0024BA036C|nr:hypothetical protein [Streptomyces sp. H27-C3]MDJ0466496.1 hypothetical protein [Streptomyces sp. H27-C3]
MGQRVVRVALAAGVIVLGLLVLLATCGGGSGKDRSGAVPREPAKRSAEPPVRLPVPAEYDAAPRWQVRGASPEYAIARGADRIGLVERVSADRFRLRAVDAASGATRWKSEAWRPLSDPRHFPRLLPVGKDGREYFVTWSFGKVVGRDDALSGAKAAVVLDVYAVEDGARRRVELPWGGVPTVDSSGPGILVSDGGADSAVVDPATGRVSRVAAKALDAPKGCRDCRVQTEVRTVTDKGLLVSGRREFWVRGGWHSRKTAPAGADAASGVPISVAGGHILATWQKKGGAGAAAFEAWAVHDAAGGRATATVECRKPAIASGRRARAVLSPEGRYLVAGRVGFDLETGKGRCFEAADGTEPLDLTVVTDTGVAYGMTGARVPVRVDLATGVPAVLPGSTTVPDAEVAGVGVFAWVDPKNRTCLFVHARRG